VRGSVFQNRPRQVNVTLVLVAVGFTRAYPRMIRQRTPLGVPQNGQMKTPLGAGFLEEGTSLSKAPPRLAAAPAPIVAGR
jgi:hypothetical protein